MLNAHIRSAAVVLLVLVVACGSGAGPIATGSQSPSPPVASGSATLVTPQPTRTTTRSRPRPKPSATSSHGLVRVVTEDDAGKTVELRVGEYLRVELGAEYQQPTAHPGGVLERTSATGGYPTGKPMVAEFHAVKAGKADVESSTDYACLHATPSCALPQQLWSVHVIVKSR